ncbi:MAG: hypothetical protein O6837_12120, partial [Deltaproteobacteria bacterium]|nr:hypothetical protein [Deltaproteobacteria bacterium]
MPRAQNRWGFPRGVAVHYSTGGRSGSSSLWSTTGLKPRGRYNLIHVKEGGGCSSVMSKVMGLREAVDRFVFDGAVVGLGGQNIGRCAMATVHEIIRQGKRDLTLVGCNLSISMDLLVGADLVRRCEGGSGNLERFGSTFC